MNRIRVSSWRAKLQHFGDELPVQISRERGLYRAVLCDRRQERAAIIEEAGMAEVGQAQRRVEAKRALCVPVAGQETRRLLRGEPAELLLGRAL